MTNTKRFLVALVLSVAALSLSGAAQADELEAYDHHLTLPDTYDFEFYWSK
ncbi:hypothetical protein [Streptomyces sp. NPDC056387]|uniref:hypothetical protein n=1 Tax=Streptomyces sp. NPDC056387 TaxID=3345803 RepID=UPI0035DB7DF1